MTGAGALVGFMLVFFLTAWAVSGLLFVALRANNGAIRRLGPAAERRVTALAAALPVVIALAVVATLIVRSLAGADHCPAHDHHAHLCVAHGEGWAERAWYVAVVAGALAMLGTRLGLLGAALVRGRRRVALLRAASTSVDGVRLVDSSRAFCFVAGLRRPEIYASTGVWNALAPEEREAMLAHERAHVDGRDLRWRAALEVLAAFGAPLTPAPLLARWEQATERLRDRDAADTVGAPELVAAAMVRVCRLGTRSADVHAFAFPAAPGALDERVEALLAGRPRGERAAFAIALAGLALVATATLAVAVHAEPLHHTLESLLG